MSKIGSDERITITSRIMNKRLQGIDRHYPADATTLFVMGSAGFQPAASGIPAGRIVAHPRSALHFSGCAGARDEAFRQDAGKSGQDARAPLFVPQRTA